MDLWINDYNKHNTKLIKLAFYNSMHWISFIFNFLTVLLILVQTLGYFKNTGEIHNYSGEWILHGSSKAEESKWDEMSVVTSSISF